MNNDNSLFNEERLNQMIETALSYPQEKRRHFTSSFMLYDWRLPAGLVATAAAFVVLFGVAYQPHLPTYHQTTDLAAIEDDAYSDLTEMMLFDTFDAT